MSTYKKLKYYNNSSVLPNSSQKIVQVQKIEGNYLIKVRFYKYSFKKYNF